MKVIMLAAFLIFSCHTAHADWLLRFKDKTANVWPSYFEKDSQYCTMKTFGEYCVRKSDLVSIKEVPAGTEASDYSVSSLGGKEAEIRKREASEITEKTISELDERQRQERYQKQRKQYKQRNYDDD
ncbi:MAG: hypothetical protein AABZ15_01355 [Nitrospirota bacterium]